ncbi:MAG: 30S ribosomal protein S17e [Nanoarchaeota archaeon]
MGRIKSLHIKRAAKALMRDNSSFTTDFKENKEVLKDYTLPDKGTRNKVAGYITRLKRAGDIPKPRTIKENDGQ